MLLYLDIDGVFNGRDTKRYGKLGYQGFNALSAKIEAKYEPNKFINHLTLLDAELCNKFIRFAKFKNTFNEVVICSTWRKVFSADELKYLFYLKGFPQIGDMITRNLMGDPKDLYPGLNRSDAEILEDARINGVDKYFILSDDVSKLIGNYYQEFLEFANS